MSAQEAVYLDLQIPLTKCTRDIVFINTSTTAERVFLLKPKSVLDELPAESTDIESSNVIQRYSKRPKQLSKFCLADYASKVDAIYPKGDKLPEKFEKKNEDEIDESSSSDKMKIVFKMKIMLMTVILQSCYTKQRMEQNIRKEKYRG